MSQHHATPGPHRNEDVGAGGGGACMGAWANRPKDTHPHHPTTSTPHAPDVEKARGTDQPTLPNRRRPHRTACSTHSATTWAADSMPPQYSRHNGRGGREERKCCGESRGTPATIGKGVFVYGGERKGEHRDAVQRSTARCTQRRGALTMRRPVSLSSATCTAAKGMLDTDCPTASRTVTPVSTATGTQWCSSPTGTLARGSTHSHSRKSGWKAVEAAAEAPPPPLLLLLLLAVADPARGAAAVGAKTAHRQAYKGLAHEGTPQPPRRANSDGLLPVANQPSAHTILPTRACPSAALHSPLSQRTYPPGPTHPPGCAPRPQTAAARRPGRSSGAGPRSHPRQRV
jgi:hypothetical protein